MAATSNVNPHMPASEALDEVEPTLFDPERHLCYERPKKSIMLQDLDLPLEGAIAPLAVTAPFPLFTPEGVKRMRAEIFQEKIMKESNGYTQRMEQGCYTLRGFVEHAPFLASVWRSEEVMNAICDAAGVDLDIIFEYEIGHINVQVEGLTDDMPLESMMPPATPPLQPRRALSTEMEHIHKAQLSPAGPWHKDCFPWVAIIMLSDTTNMIGGETGIRRGDGSILKQASPGTGWAYVLQGGCVEHIALKSFGGERVAMVTSFRPRDPMQLDLSHLGGVKGNSHWGPLFKQWSLYRLGVMEQRIQFLRDMLENKNLTAVEISEAMLEWKNDMFKYLEHTAAQVYLENKVETSPPLVRRIGKDF